MPNIGGATGPVPGEEYNDYINNYGMDSQLHSCNKFDLTVIFLFSRW